MLYRVVHQRTPAWLVGERQADVWARRRAPDASDHAQRYPGDHPGRVVLVRPASEEPLESLDGSLYETSILDVTKEEASLLASRQMKVVAEIPVLISFRDRYGAVSVGLEALYADPEKVESDEQAAINADEPIFTMNGKTFSQNVADLAMALPNTKTTTGTGLYATKVSPGSQGDVINGVPVDNLDGTWTITVTTGGFDSTWEGGYVFNAVPEPDEVRAVVQVLSATQIMLEGDCSNWSDTDAVTVYDAWSTVQGALDQLWTDQADADFTATQEVRIYAGTYTEIVTPGAFDAGRRWPLRIRANTGDTVVVRNDGLSGSVFNLGTIAAIWLEDLDIQANQTASSYWCTNFGQMTRLLRCTLGGAKHYCVSSAPHLEATDCTFNGYVGNSSGHFRRCTFSGNYYIQWGSREWVMEKCIFDESYVLFFPTQSTTQAQTGIILGCTFYNVSVAKGAIHNGSADDVVKHLAVRVRNCIFKNCTYAFHSNGGPTWMDSDHNCFHGNTHITNADGADYDTLAAWQAYTDADGNSPDQNSIDLDPKLTAPGSGDFSLQSDSPCIHAGAGAGGTKDVNGDPLDPYHPDIGAVGNGIGPGRTYGGIG